MAYENYSLVSWTDGTPITGDRLQQMSTNIEQVKDATDSSSSSLKKIKTITSSSGSFTNFQTLNEIIALEDESSTNGPDNRVSISANRYYRVTLNFTGFQVDAKGAEDSYYAVSIHSGDYNGANTTIYTAEFTPPVFAFINVASLGANATIANITLRNDAYDSRFGGGTHSVVLASDAAGFTNRSFFAAVNRFQGASATNAPAYSVPASSGTRPLQLYVEDIGGAV
jgi:hypothetical protein